MCKPTGQTPQTDHRYGLGVTRHQHQLIVAAAGATAAAIGPGVAVGTDPAGPAEAAGKRSPRRRLESEFGPVAPRRVSGGATSRAASAAGWGRCHLANLAPARSHSLPTWAVLI